MATLLIGNQLTVDITGIGTFTPQVTSVTVEGTPNRQTIELLGGPAYITPEIPYTVAAEMVLDWGDGAGLAQALTDAALTDPDTSLTFTVEAVGSTHKTVATGKVFPEVVPVNGTGNQIATVGVTLTGDPNTALSITTTTV